eukprot:NODE_475_length_1893_cov_76.975651_g468_i0.p1 GENE.NODE_475_length_1893_cov_76.975651_g468_i0~~NODE_475_length_1893_cov_76.975651_g468_i0.p1  ORF type:complete len:611 (+),score=154.88 NODE_475_length_1893_cov_76.975651_g468_i0:30-1835(+)
MGGGFGVNEVGGWISIFWHNGSDFTETQALRPNDAYYVGHSVALSDDNMFLIFGSEWWDRGTNESALLDWNQQKSLQAPPDGSAEPFPDAVHIWRRNETLEYEPFQTFFSPDNATRFGATLDLHNDTLIVGAPGHAKDTNTSNEGTVHIYKWDGEQWHHSQSLRDSLNQDLYYYAANVSDRYGEGVSVWKERAVVTTRSVNLETQAYETRMSTGAAYVYHHVELDVVVSQSTVACEYTTVTSGVRLVCVIQLRDAAGRNRGQAMDLAGITVDNSAVGPNDNATLQYVATGIYNFSFVPHLPEFQAGPKVANIVVEYEGNALSNSPYTITTEHYVSPDNTTVVCNGTAEAGYPTRCELYSSHNHWGGVAGLEDATREFSTQIYNLEYPDWRPVQQTALQYLSPGRWTFQWVPLEAGTYTVLVKYQNVPIAFPNPFYTEVVVPEINLGASSVDCPPLVAPGRNISCLVTLRGGAYGALAGREERDMDMMNATLEVGNAYVDLYTFQWVSTGKIRLIFLPEVEGTASISVRYGMTQLTNSFSAVNVQSTVQRCTLMPKAEKTRLVYVGHYRERNNDTVYKNHYSSTSVSRNVETVCEDVPVSYH